MLSRPGQAVAVAGALTCVAGCTYVALRGLPPAACVFALDGAIVIFAVWTTIAAFRTIGRFTYAYYAAY